MNNTANFDNTGLTLDYIDGSLSIISFPPEHTFAEGIKQFDSYLLVWCRQGSISANINALNYTIENHELFFCNPRDVIDSISASPDYSGNAVLISRSIVLEALSGSGLLERLILISNHPILHLDSESISILELLSIIIRKKHASGDEFLKKEILFLSVKTSLYQLISTAGKSCGSIMTHEVHSREVIFRRFIDILSTSVVKSRSVLWYASQLCISAKYLSAVSKQVSGRTASSWIREYVDIDIRNLLRNTNKTLKEISILLNFPNPSFFGKYCRDHFGMSPTQYRLALRSTPKQ
ncbi:MAG: helix-turn-helix domain-containing protein [Muribaculaceae bacterium]